MTDRLSFLDQLVESHARKGIDEVLYRSRLDPGHNDRKILALLNVLRARQNIVQHQRLQGLIGRYGLVTLTVDDPRNR